MKKLIHRDGPLRKSLRLMMPQKSFERFPVWRDAVDQK
jgi:hypothetical protein